MAKRFAGEDERASQMRDCGLKYRFLATFGDEAKGPGFGRIPSKEEKRSGLRKRPGRTPASPKVAKNLKSFSNSVPFLSGRTIKCKRYAHAGY